MTGGHGRPNQTRRIPMKTRTVLILITLLCAAMASVQSAYTATIFVTGTNDSGFGSLRFALAVANDGDTIDATGVSGTILLTSGQLQITHNVTINGPGAGTLTVNGNATSRVFYNSASNAIISGFTITNGRSFNECGGIFNQGGLTIVYSTISENVAYYPHGVGGGIFAGGATVISASTINNNTAVCEGGGIYASGALTVVNSTISGNSTRGTQEWCPMGEGGGIFLDSGGTLTITNSTISAFGYYNQRGGGIYNSGGQVTIGDTVLTFLSWSTGGTILNNGGTVISLGYNLASDGGGGVLTGPGDQISTNPMLGPLQDNGGPTFTHALLPGSPAINAGAPIFITPPPRYDQRGLGFRRVRHGRIDIGSFEVQRPP